MRAGVGLGNGTNKNKKFAGSGGCAGGVSGGGQQMTNGSGRVPVLRAERRRAAPRPGPPEARGKAGRARNELY